MLKEKHLSIKQNTFYNTFGSLYYMICQWLITVLVVRLGSFESAGTLSLCMSITNMFFTLATFGMRDFQVSDINNQFSVTNYFSTRIFTCTMSSLLCLISIAIIGQYSVYEIVCIMIYMMFRVAEALTDSFSAIEMKAARMDYICGSCVFRGTFMLVGFSVALYFTKDILTAVSFMAATSFLVVFFYDRRICKHLQTFRFDFSWREIRSLLWICFPLVLNSFMNTAIASIPRSILESMYGEYALGIYASIASPCAIMQSAVMWLYTPVITSFTLAYTNKDKKAYAALSRNMNFVLLGVFVLVFAGARLLGRWGLNLLYGEEILEYEYLLLPSLGTTAMIAVAYYLSTLLTITRKLKVIVFSNVLAAIAVAVASTPFIRRFEMSGVNYTIYLAMGINIVIQFVALQYIKYKHFSIQNGAA